MTLGCNGGGRVLMRTGFRQRTWLVLCLAIASARFPAEVTDKVFVTTGEDFVQAVLEFGRDGGQFEMVLDTVQPISLANASWVVQQDGVGRFTSGQLGIRAGSAGEHGRMAVLDAAMKSGLAPSANEFGVVWSSVVFINLCTQTVSVNPSAQLFSQWSNSIHLMPRSRSRLRVFRESSIVYIPYSELLLLVYWQTLDSSPFEAIQEGWAALVLATLPKSDAAVAHMDEFSMVINRMTLAGGEDVNVTYRTTNNPNDPLGIMLPELGGSLMPHRFCAPDGNSSGPLLSDAQIFIGNITFLPNWLVGNSRQLQNALKEMAERGLDDIRVNGMMPLSVATIMRDVSLQYNGSLPFGTVLITDTLLQGPLTQKSPTFDFASREGILSLGSTMELYFRNLVLTGLKVVDIMSEDGVIIQGASCLGLVVISRRPRQMVRVSGVTLQVSNFEFLVLLSAAHRGAQWQSGARTARFLLERISVLKPRAFNRSMLVLSEYSGWGVQGMDVTFVPRTPLLATDQLLDQASLEKRSTHDRVALGVGVGVGAGLLVLICVLAMAWRHSKQRKTHHKAVYREESLPVSTEGILIEINAKAEDGEQPVMAPSTKPGSKSSKRTSGGGQGGSVICATKATKGQGGSSTNSSSPLNSKNLTATPSSKPSSGPSLALGVPVQEISIHANAASIEAIAAEQVQGNLEGLGQLPNPHELVRQEIAGLFKVNSDDTLQLDCVLGKGAWGTVYKGTWKGLTVAVKTVLFSERTDGPTKLPQKARAILEAAVSTSMSHPNIVSTYHYDIKPVRHDEGAEAMGIQVASLKGVVDDWKLFLVLEYCHCTLGYGLVAGLLHWEGGLLLQRVLHLLLDVARGTLYLHDHQIIHGDLKPENILIKADASSPVGLVAKISDFGLSISLGPTATHASNFVLGTPFYQSPEVALTGRTTKASDAFSFGVIMAEVSSRVAPWLKVGNDFIAHPDFPTFPPAIPQAYVALALRCLETNLALRPKFQEIVSTLQDMLDSIEENLKATASVAMQQQTLMR